MNETQRFERVMYPLITLLLGVLVALHFVKAERFDAMETIGALDTELTHTRLLLGAAMVTCPEGFVCYEPYGAAPAAEYVLAGSVVIVNFVDESAMPPGIEAYAEYTVDFEQNISVCRLTVQFPTHVLGDPLMDAIGHEFLHCIVGSFHP